MAKSIGDAVFTAFCSPSRTFEGGGGGVKDSREAIERQWWRGLGREGEKVEW